MLICNTCESVEMIKNVKRVFYEEKPLSGNPWLRLRTRTERIFFTFSHPIGRQTMYGCALPKMRYDNRDMMPDEFLLLSSPAKALSIHTFSECYPFTLESELFLIRGLTFSNSKLCYDKPLPQSMLSAFVIAFINELKVSMLC